MEEKVEQILNDYIDNKKCDTTDDLNKLTFTYKPQNNWLMHAIYSFVSMVIVLVLSFSFFQLKGSSPKANKEEERFGYTGPYHGVSADYDTVYDFMLNKCYVPNVSYDKNCYMYFGENNEELGVYVGYAAGDIDFWDLTTYYLYEGVYFPGLYYEFFNDLTWNGLNLGYSEDSVEDVVFYYEIGFTDNGIYQYFQIQSLVPYEITDLLEKLFG